MENPSNEELYKLKIDSLLFAQINDVYDIAAKSDYARDDALVLPRISTILNRFRTNPQIRKTIFCLPGDFLAPSLLSKKFQGEQMVEVLNAMGLDYVCFGNHEFERQFKCSDVVRRIKESNFTWLATNFEFLDSSIENELGDQLSAIAIEHLSNSVAVFILGVLYQDKYPGFGESYDPNDMIESAIETANEYLPMGSKAPIYVALTHQDAADDLRLCHDRPELILIMGGHDHNVERRPLDTKQLIVKTRSNARNLRLNWVFHVSDDQIDTVASAGETRRQTAERISARVVESLIRITLDTGLFRLERKGPYSSYVAKSGIATFDEHKEGIGRKVSSGYVGAYSITLRTDLSEFADLVPEDPKVSEVINNWMSRSAESTEPILRVPVPLNLEDKHCRTSSTNFGNFVADVLKGTPGFERDWESTDVGFFNAGALRIDRTIQASEYISDRMLSEIFFWRNAVLQYKLSGESLRRIVNISAVLATSEADEGNGEFLQISGLQVRRQKSDAPPNIFVVSDFGISQPLNDQREYSVTTTSYFRDQANSYEDVFRNHTGVIVHSNLQTLIGETLAKLRRDLKGAQDIAPVIFSNEQRWVCE